MVASYMVKFLPHLLLKPTKKKKINCFIIAQNIDSYYTNIEYTLALGSLDLIDLNAENAAVPPPINK